MYASIGDELIWEENAVKLLGLIIDRELTFDTYVRTICKKASQKLTAILRLANILSEHRRKVLLKTFFVVFDTASCELRVTSCILRR